MATTGKPPAPVVGAAVISGLFGLIFVFAGIVTVASSGFNDATGMSLLFGAVFFGLTWTLLRGSRAAQVAGIVIGTLLVVSGVVQLATRPGAVLGIVLGAALVALLSVPRSAREYFDHGRGARLGSPSHS
ncbi:MAG TPA: hypothetical protein VES42_06870 [Pilimelia sp.]|nr:hypothetical protein [Pilimelia sp.]